MSILRDRPIRQKVALLIGAASVVGLLFAAGAVLVYELTTFRPRVLRDARTLADVVRVNTIPALQFDDEKAAAENLATLKNQPEVMSASLFRPDGTVKARYAPPGAPPPPSQVVEGARFHPDRLVLIERIEVDSQHLGWLALQYHIPPLWRRLPQYGIMVAVVLLALGAASVMLLGMLGRSVTEPLLDLAGAARQISDTRRYGLRVPPRGKDEIGALSQAFNRMLATVEEQQGALQQGEARLRLALKAARMETWIVDLSGDRAASLRELLGRARAEDREDVEKKVRAAIDAGTGFEVEFRTAGTEPEECWTALRGQVYRDERTGAPQLIGVAQDTSEHRRMEHQLIQSQRMEAIGNLAGGIAHDFNNLLTGMIGYLQFVQRRLPPDPGLREDLEQVDRAARRAAALTSQLLSYARRQMVMPTLVDLNATVTALEPMIRRLLGEDIDITIELDDTLGTTKVDPGQLEQVLLNLVANARDAMPSGGALTIRTRNASITKNAERLQPEIRTGEYVAMDVLDSGVGMSPEVRERIFEPFFTTKPPGAGTGLGLAMCYGIVKQAEGHIEVESEPGRGSRFGVLLPRESAATGPGDLPGGTAPPRGRETVLLVEDDNTVREVTARMLREMGYVVLEAENAAAARARVERDGERIDVLLTDVVMPGGSGPELADALTSGRPTLAVLFMSGYAADVVLRRGLVQESVAFIPKPFTQPALAEALRRALDARRPRS